MISVSALTVLLALASPVPQEKRFLASFLADVSKRTGIHAVAVPLLEKEQVSGPSMDTIDAANVEGHLLTMCAKLSIPGRLVRLYLPKGPNWTANEILDYARAQASLYKKPIGDLKDDSIEVLGKLVPKAEAESLIRALDLRTVYVVVPKLVSFAGRWQTTYGEMILTQKGARVTGSYSTNKGSIEGTVQGNELRVIWFEENLTSGTAVYRLSDDGMSFSGPWFNNTDPYTQAGVWTGTRILNGQSASGARLKSGGGQVLAELPILGKLFEFGQSGKSKSPPPKQ